MKRIAIAAFFTFVTLAQAQESPLILLDVKRLSTSKEVQHNWESSWGSYDRDFSRTVAVDISIRNMRQTAGETITLEVLFIAKPLSGSARWVFDRIVEEVKLDKSNTYHIVKLSKTLESSVQNYAALGQRYKSGGQIDGYIVRVLKGESIIKVAGSSHPLKVIAADQKKVDEIIAAGVDE